MLDNTSFWATLPGVLTALAGVIAAIGSLLGVLYSVGIIGDRQGRQGSDVKHEERLLVKEELLPVHRPITLLRSVAATLSNDKVNAMLVKHDFYDKRRNASGKGIVHHYESQVIGDAVVVLDHATGLMWQKAGSSTGMILAEADNYVSRLNTERFSGFNDWRVPTLEEAMSLMEPQSYDDFYIAPIFERGVNFIWTADRTPDGHGWMLYFYDGILDAEDMDFNASVRAVR